MGGTGYGMLMAAYLEDRENFDAMWNFWQQFRDNQGIMDWQVSPGDHHVLGKGGATDADEDMAMALVVAAERWGGEYLQRAKEQISRVWNYEVDHGNFAVRPGDEWGSCSTIDSSYFSPAWYKVFGKLTGKESDWNKVIDAGFAFLGKCNARNDGTGLIPQWTDCECASSPSVGKNPEHFWCDGVRVPWRIGISAAWHCDERALHQSELLASFFSKQGATNMWNRDGNGGYTITGEPLGTNETDNACTPQCFVTTGSSALVSGSKNAASRSEFWNASSQTLDSKQSCYYCDVLRLVSLLFTSGLMTEPKVNLWSDTLVV